MPKNKKFGVDIIIDDKGTLKQTGKQAKKTAGAFNVLDQSSRQADRAGKGLARTSSNSTKNFSKMSQGISGGLVPAYAVLAANIFALSAAFRFLQDSMDTANMIKGQQAFGSITGVAYQTITRDVQEATEGMLQFKEAASAVAIGIAAGLTGTQLKQLGEAAKNVSLALGRDLTDSFERLIRGVTKAEPELLDELGIVLRLENATRKYALTIGKTREELNAFERTQAVMADVLDQATQKFGRISEIMDPDAFALGRLTKEMDDMLTKFKVLLAKTLTPIFKFLSDNIVALVAVLSVVLFPILKAIGPNWGAMYKKARLEGERTEAGLVRLTAKTLAFKGALDKTGKSRGQYLFGQRQESAKGIVGMLREGGAEGEGQIGLPGSLKYNKDASLSMKASQQMTKDDIDTYSKAASKKQGIFENWSNKTLRTFHTHLGIQQATLRLSEMENSKIVAKGWQDKFTQGLTKMKLKFDIWRKETFLKMESWGASIMKWVGRAQIAMMFVVVASMLIQWGKKLAHAMQTDKVQKMREETKALTENLQSLNKELERMNQVRFEGLLYATDGLTQLGNALTSIDLVERLQQFNREMDKGSNVKRRDRKANQKEFLALADQLRIMAPAQFDTLYEAIAKGERLTGDMIKKAGWIDHYNNIRQSSQALTQYKENVQAVNAAVDKTIRTFSKMPYQDITKQLAVTIQNMGLALATGGESGAGISGQVASKKAALDAGKAEKERIDALMAPSQSGKPLAHWSTSKVIATKELAKYGGKKGMDEWLEKLQKGYDISMKQERDMTQEKERQEKLYKSILAIQKQALLIEETKIADQIKLAKIGPGSSAYHKNAKEDFKLQESQRKERQAELNIMTAQAAVELTLTKLEDMKANRKADGFDITEEDLLAQNVEYTNAVFALKNARSGLDLQKQKTINVEKETDLQKLINKRMEEREQLDERLTRNAQLRALAAAQEARALATTGTRGGRYQLRMEKITGMRDKSTDLGTQIQGKTAERGNLSGIESLTMGQYMDPGTKLWQGERLSDAMKNWNTHQKRINELTSEKLILDTNIGKEMDQITNKTLMANLRFQHEGIMYERERVYTLNPLEQKAQEMMLEQRRQQVGELTPLQITQIREMAYAQAELNIQVKLMKGIQDTLTQGFTDMFLAMVDGTESFKEGMKKLFADFMQKMADMFAEAVALRLMMNFTGGLFGGSIPATGARSGGILKAPGYKSFQGGGVSSGPSSGYLATLHGNEAIVPLGNDKSIPVKFEKGSGSVSNITVNVAAGGQQQTTTAKAGERERKLGQLIALAVQGEILDQQRPGGILSPYGDGSI